MIDSPVWEAPFRSALPGVKRLVGVFPESQAPAGVMLDEERIILTYNRPLVSLPHLSSSHVYFERAADLLACFLPTTELRLGVSHQGDVTSPIFDEQLLDLTFSPKSEKGKGPCKLNRRLMDRWSEGKEKCRRGITTEDKIAKQSGKKKEACPKRGVRYREYVCWVR